MSLGDCEQATFLHLLQRSACSENLELFLVELSQAASAKCLKRRRHGAVCVFLHTHRCQSAAPLPGCYLCFECGWVRVQMLKAQSWASETQKERPPDCESKAPFGFKFYTIHIKKEGGGREEKEGTGRMRRKRNSGLSSGISWKMGFKGWTVGFEISSTYFSIQEQMIMGWLAAERGTSARDTEMNKINTGPWHFSLKGK